MEEQIHKFTSIDAYIAAFPPAIQSRLVALRAAIHAAAPGVEEKISYNMPTFTYKGKLVYFAAAKKHIGLYGAAGSILAAIPEAAAYKTSTGTLQFPHDKPFPLELISRIIKLRAAENEAKT